MDNRRFVPSGNDVRYSQPSRYYGSVNMGDAGLLSDTARDVFTIIGVSLSALGILISLFTSKGGKHVAEPRSISTSFILYWIELSKASRWGIWLHIVGYLGILAGVLFEKTLLGQASFILLCLGMVLTPLAAIIWVIRVKSASYAILGAIPCVLTGSVGIWWADENKTLSQPGLIGFLLALIALDLTLVFGLLLGGAILRVLAEWVD